MKGEALRALKAAKSAGRSGLVRLHRVHYWTASQPAFPEFRQPFHTNTVRALVRNGYLKRFGAMTARITDAGLRMLEDQR